MPPRVVAASLLAHALLLVLAGVVAMRAPSQPAAPAEQVVTVGILSPEDYAALTPPPIERPVGPQPVVPPPDRPAEEGPLIRAKTILSGQVLADPRNRQARDTLPTLEPTERIIQLCALEAMEQVHLWQADYLPDAVSSYAFADTVVAGDTVTAEGGAFRSHGQWYELRFTCDLARDHKSVVDFAFAVGATIPEERWEGLNLDPAGEPLEREPDDPAPDPEDVLEP